jgi:electron-transferring-flavoprotein dehydrogenase
MKTFGGWFCYSMAGDRRASACSSPLDAADPMMDCHELLQRLKAHPFVRGLLGRGKVTKYGAKTVTIGGWASMPQLYTDGAMLVGDSASFLNPFRIKGIHLSMKSGMLAAEAAFEAVLKGDASASCPQAYKDRLDASWVRTEMEKSEELPRRLRQRPRPRHDQGRPGLVVRPRAAIQPFAADHTHMKTLNAYYASGPQPSPPSPSRRQVPASTSSPTSTCRAPRTTSTSPAHLKIVDTEICATKCKEEYGNPCTKFCPAQVYNMVPNEATGRAERLLDCVHGRARDAGGLRELRALQDRATSATPTRSSPGSRRTTGRRGRRVRHPLPAHASPLSATGSAVSTKIIVIAAIAGTSSWADSAP